MITKDTNSIIKLGIDTYKADLIAFLIENESLNEFVETEHFFYWFHKSECTFKDNFKFINYLHCDVNSFKVKIDEVVYDFNKFDDIASFVVATKDLNKIREIFNSNTNYWKKEYFLRYSKKYNKLEYYCNYSTLKPLNKKNVCLISHNKHKFFSINEKNYVLCYLNSKFPRYISNKNVLFIKPIYSYNFRETNSLPLFQDYENYVLRINRILLSIHQKNKVFTEQNFIQSALDLKDIPNKLMMNIKNLDELLLKITKNKKIPKILTDKFRKTQLVNLFCLVEFDEVDKFIKFLYENIDIYDEIENQKTQRKKLNPNYSNNTFFENNIFRILVDLLSVKFNLIYPDHIKKDFSYSQDTHHQTIHDYVRMCQIQGKKINLKIKSLNRIVQEHDRLSMNFSISKIPNIKVNKSYPEIESQGNFEIEKISNKKRLVLESKIQSHCVQTYYHNINAGRSCIYSFLDKRDNKRYTLEVIRKFTPTNKLIFILNQIKGKFNSDLPAEILNEIYIILSSKKIFSNLNSARIFFDKLSDKKNQLKTNKKNNSDDYNFIDVQLPF